MALGGVGVEELVPDGGALGLGALVDAGLDVFDLLSRSLDMLALRIYMRCGAHVFAAHKVGDGWAHVLGDRVW